MTRVQKECTTSLNFTCANVINETNFSHLQPVQYLTLCAAQAATFVIDKTTQNGFAQNKIMAEGKKRKTPCLSSCMVCAVRTFVSKYL